MSSKHHLTTREKIMNMQKVGIVSTEQNASINSGMRLITYTLCEYQGKARRNRSWFVVRLIP